uniref:Uncharacterized protein n=1 Tax=Chromera velia CCMP2878 TaxID=1169474 RepID=A0A0G4FYD4_9ALVE|eukprot:Cvel_19302.t1-p1 / transcript=Cvel_19302.t1 / gene=Cvel_19302 / organism=Chromera_velia_CCMP2878 / gene_product=hypothetical protein / transcript_product=hypothetical protein / location=Cvel_scaffold1653:21640-29829(-) / protein_length=1502 / sequence_SO=supercontig / SO=protein_coding / is_pseudo=false
MCAWSLGPSVRRSGPNLRKHTATSITVSFYPRPVCTTPSSPVSVSQQKHSLSVSREEGRSFSTASVDLHRSSKASPSACLLGNAESPEETGSFNRPSPHTPSPSPSSVSSCLSAMGVPSNDMGRPVWGWRRRRKNQFCPYNYLSKPNPDVIRRPLRAESVIRPFPQFFRSPLPRLSVEDLSRAVTKAQKRQLRHPTFWRIVEAAAAALRRDLDGHFLYCTSAVLARLQMRDQVGLARLICDVCVDKLDRLQMRDLSSIVGSLSVLVGGRESEGVWRQGDMKYVDLLKSVAALVPDRRDYMRPEDVGLLSDALARERLFSAELFGIFLEIVEEKERQKGGKGGVPPDTHRALVSLLSCAPEEQKSLPARLTDRIEWTPLEDRKRSFFNSLGPLVVRQLTHLEGKSLARLAPSLAQMGAAVDGAIFASIARLLSSSTDTVHLADLSKAAASISSSLSLSVSVSVSKAVGHNTRIRNALPHSHRHSALSLEGEMESIRGVGRQAGRGRRIKQSREARGLAEVDDGNERVRSLELALRKAEEQQGAANSLLSKIFEILPRRLHQAQRDTGLLLLGAAAACSQNRGVSPVSSARNGPKGESPSPAFFQISPSGAACLSALIVKHPREIATSDETVCKTIAALGSLGLCSGPLLDTVARAFEFRVSQSLHDNQAEKRRLLKLSTALLPLCRLLQRSLTLSASSQSGPLRVSLSLLRGNAEKENVPAVPAAEARRGQAASGRSLLRSPRLGLSDAGGQRGGWRRSASAIGTGGGVGGRVTAVDRALRSPVVSVSVCASDSLSAFSSSLLPSGEQEGEGASGKSLSDLPSPADLSVRPPHQSSPPASEARRQPSFSKCRSVAVAALSRDTSSLSEPTSRGLHSPTSTHPEAEAVVQASVASAVEALCRAAWRVESVDEEGERRKKKEGSSKEDAPLTAVRESNCESLPLLSDLFAVPASRRLRVAPRVAGILSFLAVGPLASMHRKEEEAGEKGSVALFESALKALTHVLVMIEKRSEVSELQEAKRGVMSADQKERETKDLLQAGVEGVDACGLVGPRLAPSTATSVVQFLQVFCQLLDGQCRAGEESGHGGRANSRDSLVLLRQCSSAFRLAAFVSGDERLCPLGEPRSTFLGLQASFAGWIAETPLCLSQSSSEHRLQSRALAASCGISLIMMSGLHERISWRDARDRPQQTLGASVPHEEDSLAVAAVTTVARYLARCWSLGDSRLERDEISWEETLFAALIAAMLPLQSEKHGDGAEISKQPEGFGSQLAGAMDSFVLSECLDILRFSNLISDGNGEPFPFVSRQERPWLTDSWTPSGVSAVCPEESLIVRGVESEILLTVSSRLHASLSARLRVFGGRWRDEMHFEGGEGEECERVKSRRVLPDSLSLSTRPVEERLRENPGGETGVRVYRDGRSPLDLLQVPFAIWPGSLVSFVNRGTSPGGRFMEAISAADGGDRTKRHASNENDVDRVSKKTGGLYCGREIAWWMGGGQLPAEMNRSQGTS